MSLDVETNPEGDISDLTVATVSPKHSKKASLNNFGG